MFGFATRSTYVCRPVRQGSDECNRRRGEASPGCDRWFAVRVRNAIGEVCAEFSDLLIRECCRLGMRELIADFAERVELFQFAVGNKGASVCGRGSSGEGAERCVEPFQEAFRLRAFDEKRFKSVSQQIIKIRATEKYPASMTFEPEIVKEGEELLQVRVLLEGLGIGLVGRLLLFRHGFAATYSPPRRSSLVREV